MSSPLPTRKLLVALLNTIGDDHTTFTVDAPGVTPAHNHWTDISAYAPYSSYRIDRGVEHNLGQGQAGTLAVDLRNVNGEFNTWISDNAVPTGKFAPWLAAAGDGGTINTALGGIKVPVQVRDSVGAAGPYYAFTGYANAWKPLWPDPISNWVELQATDSLQYFNDQPVANTRYTTLAQSLGSGHYWRCNDTPGSTTVADYIGGTPATLVGPVTLTGAGGSGAGLLLGEPNSGSASFEADGYIDVTGHGVNGTLFSVAFMVSGISQGTTPVLASQGPVTSNTYTLYVSNNSIGLIIVDSGGTTHVGSLGTALLIADGLSHHIVFTYDGTNIFVYIDGQQVMGGPLATFTMSSGAAGFFAAGDPSSGSAYGGVSMSEILIVNGVAITPTQVANLYNAAIVFSGPGAGTPQYTGPRIASVLGLGNWPANLQSLANGNQLCQQNTQDMSSTTWLTHMQDVEQTEEGALWVNGAGVVTYITRQDLSNRHFPSCTFGDALADIPVKPGVDLGLDDIDLATGATVTRVNGLAQLVGNTVSSRAIQVSGVLHLSDGASYQHAAWLQSILKSPTTRLVSFSVDLTTILGNPTLVEAALAARELFSAVIFERTASGFSKAGFVEHVSEVTTADSWVITYSLDVARYGLAYTSWGYQ